MPSALARIRSHMHASVHAQHAHVRALTHTHTHARAHTHILLLFQRSGMVVFESQAGRLAALRQAAKGQVVEFDPAEPQDDEPVGVKGATACACMSSLRGSEAGMVRAQRTEGASALPSSPSWPAGEAHGPWEGAKMTRRGMWRGATWP